MISSIARAKKGYTNKELGAAWMRDFDGQTHMKNDEPRVLFLDGHNSHYSNALLDYATENGIRVLGYWARMTHVAQGLDVVCFGALKIEYGLARDEYERRTGREIDGSSFLQVYAEAHCKIFTTDLVKKAFEKTGIHPWNPDAISLLNQAPSRELSTQETGFPIPQPTPVKRMVDAMRITLKRQWSHSCPPRNTTHSPETPTPQQLGLSTTEKSLTDTQCASKISGSLASSSVSWLVSETNPFTSMSRIPAPVFDHLPAAKSWDNILATPPAERTYSDLELENKLLREKAKEYRAHAVSGEELLEAQNCQMVLQNIYIEGARQQLHYQEQKKQKGATEAILNTEMGRIFTSDEFREAVHMDEARRASEKSAKDIRKGKREWRAKEKVEIEKEWAETKKAWAAKKVMLQAEGKKSGWGRQPAKPKRATTPDMFKAAPVGGFDDDFGLSSSGEAAEEGEDEDEAML